MEHLIQKQFFLKKIQAVYKKCDQVCVEIDTIKHAEELHIASLLLLLSHPELSRGLIRFSNLKNRAKQKMHLEHESGEDTLLLQMAHEDKKKVISLETIKTQMEQIILLIKKMNEEELLFSSLKEDRLSSRLIAGIYQGNDNELLEIKRAETETIKVSYNHREAELAEKITHLFDEGINCLVAIGAFHLVGENCVSDLLKDRGVHVERISLD